MDETASTTQQPLNSRADCVAEIRRLAGDDLWATRYALLTALQELDLGGVNRVLQWLEEATGGVGFTRTPLRRLLDERWQ